LCIPGAVVIIPTFLVCLEIGIVFVYLPFDHCRMMAS
jgi:hypothetical protein